MNIIHDSDTGIKYDGSASTVIEADGMLCTILTRLLQRLQSIFKKSITGSIHIFLAEMMTYARELALQQKRIVEITKDMYLHSATGKWSDFWGYMLGNNERVPNESDAKYVNRVVREVIEANQNNVGLETIIMQSLTNTCKAIKVKDSFNVVGIIYHDGQYVRDSQHCRNGKKTSLYAHFTATATAYIDKEDVQTNPSVSNAVVDAVSAMYHNGTYYHNGVYTRAGTAHTSSNKYLAIAKGLYGYTDINISNTLMLLRRLLDKHKSAGIRYNLILNTYTTSELPKLIADTITHVALISLNGVVYKFPIISIDDYGTYAVIRYSIKASDCVITHNKIRLN